MLEDCLLSCAHYVDEIILTDTGSTDGTKVIAENIGKIVNHPWQDDFSAAEMSVWHMLLETVLVLDADERSFPVRVHYYASPTINGLRTHADSQCKPRSSHARANYVWVGATQ